MLAGPSYNPEKSIQPQIHRWGVISLSSRCPKIIALALALAAFANVELRAGILSADFAESLDLPAFTLGDASTFANLGATLGPGDELDESHQTSINSLNGMLRIDLDGTTLTLTQVGLTDFQWVTIDITNILFSNNEVIDGITLVGPSIIDSTVSPTTVPNETLSFSGSSIQLEWKVPDIFDMSQTFSFVQGGVATYEITLKSIPPSDPSGEVPEPSSVAILGVLGLTLVAFRRNSKVSNLR